MYVSLTMVICWKQERIILNRAVFLLKIFIIWKWLRCLLRHLRGFYISPPGYFPSPCCGWKPNDYQYTSKDFLMLNWGMNIIEQNSFSGKTTDSLTPFCMCVCSQLMIPTNVQVARSEFTKEALSMTFYICVALGLNEES